jgi:hypothetical protein
MIHAQTVNIARTFAAVALVTLTTIATSFTTSAQTPPAAEHAAAPNVQVSHDDTPIHVEPSVAVNPANAQNLLAAAQLIPTSGPTAIGTYASFDGGRTWQETGPLPFPTGTNTGDDVTIAFDAAGHGFVAAMATSEADGQMSRTDRNVVVWRSDDGGRTFAPPVLAAAHQFVDHPWLAVDPADGTLFLTWVAEDHASAGFTRSTDGGTTFDPARTVARPPGSVSMPVLAAANGAVAIAYETGINGADPFAGEDDETDAAHAHAAQEHTGDVDARIEVVASADGGTTFGDPVALAEVPSEPALASGARLPTGPSITAGPNGALDVAYAAFRSGSDQLAVFLAHSDDGGRTFGAPVSVAGDAPTGTAYFQPQVVVDETGAIDVTAFALANGRVDVLLWRAASAAGHFGPARRITGESFDPAKGMTGTKHGAWWIGDYQGLATGGGVLYPLWNDTRTGNLELFAAALPIAGVAPNAATPAA